MLSLHQRGLSLIELLIAMSAGLLVVGAGLSILTGALGAAGANLLRVRLHQDLQSVTEAIARDLARAGEWALADEVTLVSANNDLQLSGSQGSISASVLARDGSTPSDAFGFPNADAALRGAPLVLMQRDGAVVRRHDLIVTGVPAPDRLTLSIPDGVVLTQTRAVAGSWSILNPFAAVSVNGTGTCILLRYDLDGDGVQDDEEHFGFRLNSMRTAIQTTTTARDCIDGNWDAFTDPAHLRIASFDVRRLRAPLTNAGPINAMTDAYFLRLEARLTRDPQATRSVEHLVQSRNSVLE
ncbi:MAG: hypothetical protein K0Q76_2366 [Panacagrimonas sp.]|jgi:prepilin-type N-terminal cleavage/methylation domain-containing protein|nr:prepilin-type N-terminal cleavage/methylation domain-containing protein [Panacagrimonas sp.]MCC2657258.1 hypothetical protein [Panacagrimonas sp.]